MAKPELEFFDPGHLAWREVAGSANAGAGGRDVREKILSHDPATGDVTRLHDVRDAVPQMRRARRGCMIAAMPVWLVIALVLLLARPAAAAPCAEPYTALFERVSPAVISIQTMKINKERPQRRFETIVGSGFFIDKEGYALTNAHVVDGAASLSVTLDNGDKLAARTIGFDPVLDLALIRVEGKNGLPIVRFGDSSTLRVGEEVVAIGNPIGLDQTMTRGIVSGLNRLLPGVSDQPMIQTDAPINPGNSGGPLVDRCGAVVGINTFISEEAQSIGFAVPVNAVKGVLKDLREFGKVVRPWIGVQGRAVDQRLISFVRMPLAPGYLVEVVYDGSPADRAGIRGGSVSIVLQGDEYLLGGDVVTAINGQPVRNHQEYITRVNTLRPGQRARVTVARDGQSRELTLTVAERPRLPGDLAE